MQMATWTRLVASSLRNRCEMCALTVATLRWSCSAISALELPRPTAIATSRSRSVKHGHERERRLRSPVRASSVTWRISCVRDRRRQHRLAGLDLADGGDDLGGRRVLEQESVGAGRQRAHDVLVGVERRQHDDLRRIGERGDRGGRGDAVHHRHAQVHQHDVDATSPYGLDGLARRWRPRPRPRCRGAPPSMSASPARTSGVVVGDEHARHAGHGSHDVERRTRGRA